MSVSTDPVPPPTARTTPAAVITGLTPHEAAHAAEIVRGGVISVEQGRVEAAPALGRGRPRLLLRPPGSGRCTLPRCANHLEKINTGEVEVDGELIGRTREFPARVL